MSSSDDAARNRELWTKSNADHTGPSARRHWAAEEITWGIFGVPEATVCVLPELDGKEEFGLEFPLIEADAAETGLADGCADLVVSEYGASIWVDPYRWIPEAARLLRPGGELVFLRNSTLVILCSPDGDQPAGEQLVRPLFGLHRLDCWDGVEFHLAHGDWIRLLRANGFEILDLVELQAPPDAETDAYYDFVTADWARNWPAEEIWKARKR